MPVLLALALADEVRPPGGWRSSQRSLSRVVRRDDPQYQKAYWGASWALFGWPNLRSCDQSRWQHVVRFDQPVACENGPH